MLDMVSRILFVVSTTVLVPVIVALLGLTLWTVLLSGGMLREGLARRTTEVRLRGVLRSLLDGTHLHATIQQLTQIASTLPAIGFVPRYLRTCWVAEPEATSAQKIIDDIEIEMGKRVATLSTIARLGPMLGLTGTLIPLGPGLVHLAQGDVAGLANQLVIAFSTTVVGLLVGMIAFAGGQIRRGWYAKDLSDVLFLDETRCPKEPVPA